jgi:acyl dehydratase
MVNDHGLRYFEDYALGTTYECGSVSIDAASIVNFGQEFDPQSFHTDPVAAADGPFGGLIASGWQTAALTMRLLVDNYLSAEASLGGAGVDEIRWPYPPCSGHGGRVQAITEQTGPGHHQDAGRDGQFRRPDGHAVHRDQPPARPPGRGVAE